MPWLKSLRSPGLIAIAGLFFAVPAMAQFEVSPDHFDSDASQQQAAKVKHNAGIHHSTGLLAAKSTGAAKSMSHTKTLADSKTVAVPQSPANGLNRTNTSRTDRKPLAGGQQNRVRQLAGVSSSISQRE